MIRISFSHQLYLPTKNYSFMKLPDNLKPKINKSLFTDYLLNKDHFMGRFTKEAFARINVSIENVETLIESLNRIPLEQEYLHIEVLYKLGFIYRVQYVSSIAINNKKFYLKTIWLHKEKTKDIELLNLILI
ncbi:DUF6883 domain-containing protein [Ignavibacterium sp.]|uniref:DUF6883 domain-containing protein n=1 Tax=Ignavibacterium sp. TaxID=2651167 RepID=UPI003296CE4C